MSSPVEGEPARVQICSNCGEENPARFRLCGFCGTPLTGVLPAEEVRKTVTIVFSDLKGSTSLAEAIDSESLREVMLRYFEAMRAELERHDGTIEKYIGDAVMAVFGMPTIHEDDALRAVRAAAGMQRALARLNDELERTWGVRLTNRTGVNTGEVVAADPAAGQRLVVGDAVNTAARLEQAAPENEVLLGPLTYRLVRDAVEVEPVEPLELKGKAERVQAYRLVGLRARKEVSAAGGGPMVGRDAELALLQESFHDSVRDRTVRLVTVVGDAGIGKSRLTREFVASIADGALVARGRCLPYGEGITFWPLVEIVREAAGIHEEDSSEVALSRLVECLGDEEVAVRISSAIGLSTAEFSLPELFWGFQRFIEVLDRRGPVVLVIDDIHWAEATLLDLLEHLLTAPMEAAALIVCTSRDDLRETRPSWGDHTNARHCVLKPLTDADASQIAEAMLREAGIAGEIRNRVIAAAEGNPLFVEQMLSMLVDQGGVGGNGRGGAAGRFDVSIPPTIEGLLAARLDSLGREERAVVEPAAVIGLTFPETAVATMVPESLRTSTPVFMASLERKRLVHRDQTTLGNDSDHRFHHLLIRDAAYNRILKRTRARLHEQFVAWADEHNEERHRALESEEILGYHLEQAHRYLSELGPLGDHGTTIGAQGSQRLASAGRRAFIRGDMPAAASLLGRAAALLGTGMPERISLLTDAAEAMTEAGEFAEADAALEAAIVEAGTVKDTIGETNARLVQLFLHYVTVGDRPDEVADQVRQAIVVLEASGDHKGLTRAWRTLLNIRFAGCRYLDAEGAAHQMIEHARLADDHAMEMRVPTALATCAQLGPTPVPQAIKVVKKILAGLQGDRKSEAYTQRALGNLEAMRGRFDEARSLCRTSRATLEELGWRHDAALTGAIASGPVELLAGDPAAAEAELRRDYDALDAMGERNYISTTAALLAEALYRQGRLDEADQYSQISQDVGAADDVTTQVLWRCLRGKLLAHQGRFDEATSLAAEAIRIIGEAQDPDTQGNAMLDLSEIRRLAGQREAAVTAAEEALALFAQKANASSERRARAVIVELASDVPTAGSA